MSPHEQEGSSGVAGMLMSAMSAPVYVQALWGALRGRDPGFVVTRKGAVAGDHLGVFRRHLTWAAVIGGVLIASVPLGHGHVAVQTWAVFCTLMCLMPVVLWRGAAARRRRAGLRRYRLGANSAVDQVTAVPAVVSSPAPLLIQESLS